MTPGVYNFTQYQGTTLRKSFVWKPGGVVANLTGYSAIFQMRVRNTADTATPILELKSISGGIFLGTTNGTTLLAGGVTLYAPVSVFGVLPVDTYMYGINLIDSAGDSSAFLTGELTIMKHTVR